MTSKNIRDAKVKWFFIFRKEEKAGDEKKKVNGPESDVAKDLKRKKRRKRERRRNYPSTHTHSLSLSLSVCFWMYLSLILSFFFSSMNAYGE